MPYAKIVHIDNDGKILYAKGFTEDFKGRMFKDVFEVNGEGIISLRYNGESYAYSKINTDDGQILIMLPESPESLVENFPVGFFIMQDRRVVFVNKIIEEVSGYTRDEIYSIDPFQLIKEEYRKKAEDMYRRCIENGEPVREEFKLTGKNGSEIFVEVLMSRGYFNGKPAVIGGIVDITQRKEFESLFLALANQTFTIVYIVQDGRFVFLNDTMSLSGYSAEELFQMNPFDIVHPDDREMVLNNYLRRIRGEEVRVPYSFRIVAKDGSIKVVDAIAARVMLGNRPAVIGMLIDRTTERQVEEKLKMYERFFKEARDMFFILDERGRFVDVNPRFAEILGYRHSEIIGQTSKRIVFDNDLRILKENFDRVMKGESVKFTFRAKCKNGEERIFEVVEWPVFKDGEISGAEGVLRDITDRVRTENELKKTNELLRTISAINELIFKERDEYSLISKVCKVFSRMKKTDCWAWIIEKDRMLKAVPLAPDCKLAEKAKDGVMRYEMCSCPMSTGMSVAVPAKHNGRVFGVLVLCSVGDMRRAELRILEELGEDLGFAISSYITNRDRKIALNLLLSNLEQFENLADRLRNPVAIISGYIEICDDIGHERTIKEISKQVDRIKEILDELRLQETLTYFILRGEKLK